MKYIKERLNDYNLDFFINELCEASKGLGLLEAKIDSYRFNTILIPMLHKKEAISSMYIEGTQTTISDVLENEVNLKNEENRIMKEVSNHSKALRYGAEYLRMEDFSNEFIQKIHEIMLEDVINESKKESLGKYKATDNFITNSVGTIVFTPPSYKETKKYMDELINFMNANNDGFNPLIKAAIIHSQFESIHPFEDGNGRVGRLLISLYLFKSKVINCPFFYISEAISQEKTVYYNKLTDSRKNNYNEWIRFFLQKVIVQTSKHIKYLELLNGLYNKTKTSIKQWVNSAQYDSIIECLFMYPILTSSYLSNKLDVSMGQAMRYLNILEEKQVLIADDRKRNKKFYFMELLDLISHY